MSTVRILIEHEGDVVVGQCLEHDFCVQGKDYDDVRRRILLQLSHFSAEPGGLDGVGRAPDDFFRVWDSGKTPPARMKIKINDHEVDAEFKLVAA